MEEIMRKFTEVYENRIPVPEVPEDESGIEVTGKFFLEEEVLLGKFKNEDIEYVLDWSKAVGLDRISIKEQIFDVKEVRVYRTHRDDSSRIRGNSPTIKYVFNDVTAPTWELYNRVKLVYLDWYTEDSFGTRDSDGIIILQTPESEEWRLSSEPPAGIEFPRGEFATVSSLISGMAGDFEYALRTATERMPVI